MLCRSILFEKIYFTYKIVKEFRVQPLISSTTPDAEYKPRGLHIVWYLSSRNVGQILFIEEYLHGILQARHVNCSLPVVFRISVISIDTTLSANGTHNLFYSIVNSAGEYHTLLPTFFLSTFQWLFRKN
jgi:hypothetical protein